MILLAKYLQSQVCFLWADLTSPQLKHILPPLNSTGHHISIHPCWTWLQYPKYCPPRWSHLWYQNGIQVSCEMHIFVFIHCSPLFIQWSHCCHDDQPGGFPDIRAHLHVVMRSPQEDVGRVVLGVYDGLVALHHWPSLGC